MHDDPQLARHVEFLEVDVSRANAAYTYSGAEHARDLAVFNADVAALGYAPVHARTRGEIRERVEHLTMNGSAASPVMRSPISVFM